jgi:8-oxo-dGTP pyrophosphatase MutT (NUDIX family)
MNGEVLLVEHVFHPVHPWGLPGGWVDHNENPAQTVQRELREELELDVQVGPLLHFEVTFGSHLDFAYRCETTDEVGQLSGELLSFRWVAPDNLPPMHDFHYHAIQSGLAQRVTA